jgi:tetratricopeptide (TPR) repeat protein
MAPEQAAGRVDELSSVSDVYSLGATLYASLTGKPPFSGPINEVIERVQRGDFLKPRQVNSYVPAPLEAVCLKAMSLTPDCRYPSALDLAADVDHWLADEPVSCYEEPWLSRMARWGRKHRTLVIVLGAVLLAAMVVLAVTAGVLDFSRRRIAEEKGRTEEALESESNALKQTRQALNAATDDVIERLLAKQVQLGADEKAYLRKVLGFYEQFAGKLGDSVESQSARADGLVRIAAIRSRLGELAESEAAQREALTIREALAKEFPDDATYRGNLAQSLNSLAILLFSTGKQEEATGFFEAALTLQQYLAEGFPNQPGYRNTLAGFLGGQGSLLQDTGHVIEAEKTLRQAVAIGRQLVADNPNDLPYMDTLATAVNNLARQRIKSGNRQEAEELFGEAVNLRRRLVDASPAVPEARDLLGRSLRSAGALADQTGRPDLAEKRLREARTVEAEPSAGVLVVATDRGLKLLICLLGFTQLGVQVRPVQQIEAIRFATLAQDQGVGFAK